MQRCGPARSAVLLVALFAACAGPGVPQAMAPTLDAWRALGMGCSGPREDNVPNDLLQWTCRVSLQGVSLTATLDGNGGGVFGVVAEVPAATETAAAGEAFATFAEATPFLRDARGLIPAWIRAEIDGGARTTASIEGVSLAITRDSMWITLNAFPEDRPALSALRP